MLPVRERDKTRLQSSLEEKVKKYKEGVAIMHQLEKLN